MTVIGLSAEPIEANVNEEMDLDLSEYDQVDEVKSVAWQPQNLFTPQNTGNKNNTVSSSSNNNNNIAVGGANSSEDSSSCENDFVFLPAPPSRNQPVELKQPSNLKQQLADQPAHKPIDYEQTDQSKLSPIGFRSTQASNNNLIVRSQPTASLPLSTRNANLSPATGNNNPFDSNANCHLPQSIVGSPSKPIGLLEVSSSANFAGATGKLDDLLHQIVTRSDMIYIAIPCAYCHEPIACPPSDISAWLNHMSRVHNCKACPICNKMIGLGPRRDIEIMRRHVLAHLDEEWLNRRANQTNFTFGLQQQWFSGSRCTVKEVKYRY